MAETSVSTHGSNVLLPELEVLDVSVTSIQLALFLRKCCPFLIFFFLSLFPAAIALAYCVLGGQQLQNSTIFVLFNKSSSNANSCPKLVPSDAPMLAFDCLIEGKQSSFAGENLGLPCQD